MKKVNTYLERVKYALMYSFGKFVHLDIILHTLVILVKVYYYFVHPIYWPYNLYTLVYKHLKSSGQGFRKIP